MLSLIAAIGKNRELGKDNQLLWRIPDDLKRFKRLTDGHPVIMGRKTWESLPEKFRPLPGRTNIVVSRQPSYPAQGAWSTTSLAEAIAHARGAPGSDEIFVIGGAQLYAEALPLADTLYLTLIDADAPADVFFPAYETEFTHLTEDGGGIHEDISFRWIDARRSV